MRELHSFGPRHLRLVRKVLSEGRRRKQRVGQARLQSEDDAVRVTRRYGYRPAPYARQHEVGVTGHEWPGAKSREQAVVLVNAGREIGPGADRRAHFYVGWGAVEDAWSCRRS